MQDKDLKGKIKIKHLPPNTNLSEMKYKGKKIVSAWHKGLWLRGKGNEIIPVCFPDGWDEIKELEVEFI